MAAYHLIRQSRCPGWNKSSVSRLYGVSARMVHSPIRNSTPSGGAKQSMPPVSFYRCYSAVAVTSNVVVTLPAGSYRGERSFHFLTKTPQQDDVASGWQMGLTTLAAKKLVDLLSKGWWEHKQNAPQLPRKPPHPLKPRTREVEELESKIKKLIEKRKKLKAQEPIVLYITGMPGFGKTQLAREYGKGFFHGNSYPHKKVFVGTLDATNKDTFIHSYHKLAMDLGCDSETMLSRNASGKMAEFESLDLLSVVMRQKLSYRTWLLIIDNLGSVNNWIGSRTMHEDWSTLWPQPGDEEWGEGCVLVTTQDRALVKRSNPLADELYLSEMMSVEDAADMLEAVSEVKDARDKALAVASSKFLHRAPLSTASAGFYILHERLRNPAYSFRDYLSGLEKGIQEEAEKLMTYENSNYPFSTTMGELIFTDIKALLEDPVFYKVFLLLAVASNTPMPLSVVARVLQEHPDINSVVLEKVRSCVYLCFSSSLLRKWAPELPVRKVEKPETVSLHADVREVVHNLMLSDSPAAQERNDLLQHMIACVLDEYSAGDTPDSSLSHPLHPNGLLLLHMKAFLKISETVPGFHLDASLKQKLCYLVGRSSEQPK